MLTVRNNQFIDGLTMADFPTSRGDVIAARATEAIVRSPFLSVLRMRERSQAGGRMLSTSEVQHRLAFTGLELSFGAMPEERLNSLIEDKLKERRRQRIVASGPQDLGTKTLGLFAELATTIVDPINLASAFIPVVREARFAAWSARFGKPLARLARGTTEGLVGAAVVEPLVLAAATQEQADYGFMDSMLNVTFGAILGGGLHVTLGKAADIRSRSKGQLKKLSDMIVDLDPEIRTHAMRAAVANVNEGVEPNPMLYLSEDAAVRGDVDARVDVPSLKEIRLRIKEQNATRIVEDVPQKLQAEVDRIESPRSTILADVDGAEAADLRTQEISARKFDAAEAEEVTLNAEEDLRASSRAFLEDADDELLALMGLKRNLDDIEILSKSNELIADAKQQEEAIDALIACMKRG